MKKSIILNTKPHFKRLLKVVQALEVVWPSDQMTIFCVLLQNLAFESYECEGFSFEKEYDRMKNILNAFKAFQEYYNYHVVNYIIEEIEMHWCAASFNSDMDEEEEE